MAFAYLPQQGIDELYNAALATGLDDPARRQVLLKGVPPAWAGNLAVGMPPNPQVLSDLRALNEVKRLADGTVPFQVWLHNAVLLTKETLEGQTIAKILDEVAGRASGEPELPPPRELPEYQEEIIHEDDTLAYSFLLRGVAAGVAVAKLVIPSYQDGVARMLPTGPERHTGTAWLIAPDLVVTNAHVVNARDRGEPPPSAQDLQKQVGDAAAVFGYDSDEVATRTIRLTRAEAVDQSLDYAICRLEEPAQVPPLRVARALLPALVNGRHPAVNIIQHPMGDPKRVAMRNNLVSYSDARDIRYFTDTRRGSSGSPVFDDDWTVVAIHRGSRVAEGVKFQGRDSAYVNLGTQTKAILDHVRQTAPAVGDEVDAAQATL